MVAKPLTLIDAGANRAFSQAFGRDLVVDSPSNVLGPSLPAIAPPSVPSVGCVRFNPTIGVQQFFRVRAGAEWSMQALTLSLKDEGETYFVHPELYAELANEVRVKLLYLYVTRDGSPGLWPVNMPGDDGRLDTWSQSAHSAAGIAQSSWIRLQANRTVGAYEVRAAAALNDEPVWPDLTMREILNLAFRDKLITSTDHPIVKNLRGEA